MLLNSNRNNEYVKRADGGFARGQATEDFWQKPAGASSDHLAAGSGVLLKEKPPPPPPRRPAAPWAWAEEVRAAAAARAAEEAFDATEYDDEAPLRALQAKLVALRRLRDAAGVEDAAKLEAEAAEAAKAVDAHRRSVGKAWPVAPRYLRHGGDREEVVAGTDSLGNNARVVPPPLQQQPSLENATRWPVDAVLARLRAHLAMGRRDPRFGLKTATQELRRLVFVLQPPVADSLGPRELCRLFAALGLRITDHQGQLILDACAAPAGLSINSMGTLARAASQHKVAPPPTQQMNATQQRRCLVETPPPPPPSPPRKPKAQEEATLGHDLADYINDDDGAHPPSNRPESPEPHNQTNPRPPTAGRNARRARQPVTMLHGLADVELQQNKDHYRRNIEANKRSGRNIIF